jgi:hypothetical protein
MKRAGARTGHLGMVGVYAGSFANSYARGDPTWKSRVSYQSAWW